MLIFTGLLMGGCVGTPKVSQWISPPEKHLTVGNAFDAAFIAGTENKFTVINSDRQAGVISMKQETYGGDHKNNERRMSVRMKKLQKNTIEVRTKVSGSDFGIIEWMLGGLVHEEITNKFYAYLFKELNIADPEQMQVVITDENAAGETSISTAKNKEVAPAKPTKAEESFEEIQAKPVEGKSEPIVASESSPSPSASLLANQNNAKVRKSPSLKGAVIKTLKKGEEVQMVKRRDEWLLVELAGGETGWCHNSVLSQKN